MVLDNALPARSSSSLLIASGRDALYVARQMGHSPVMLMTRYAHIFDEFEDRRIDPEILILEARTKLAQTA
jgi:hypothetical protein